ncbi:RHS repeat domain-containing protein [Streptomyces antimycoticus]
MGVQRRRSGPEGCQCSDQAYDLFGRLTKATDPNKGTSTSVYDDRGQLTSTTDACDT